MEADMMQGVATSTMAPEIYSAAKEGNVTFLKELLGDESVDIASYLTLQKNTLLHIVAANSYTSEAHGWRKLMEIYCFAIELIYNLIYNLIFGPQATTYSVSPSAIELAEEIIKRKPSLIFQPNMKGETPLHVAAAAATENDHQFVDYMVELYEKHCLDIESLHGSLYMMQNNSGETALHVAMKNRNHSTALRLLKLQPTLANCVTEDCESPLFLAAERGWDCCVKYILDLYSDKDNGIIISWEGREGRTPLHAAVLNNFPEILEKLVNELQRSEKEEDSDSKALQIIRKQDEFGRTALHYAASYDGSSSTARHNAKSKHGARSIEILLKADHSLGYTLDMEGLTPLFTAVALANYDSVKAIIKYCPDSVEQRCPKGQNILHFAVKSGSIYITRVIMRIPGLAQLMNEGDEKGNSPLHLATIFEYKKLTKVMLSHKAINSKVKNEDGLEASETLYMDYEHCQPKDVGGVLFARALWRQELEACQPLSFLLNHHDDNIAEEQKEGIDMLALIATLLCAITFAAAFTVPGGYSVDATEEGLPVFIKKAAFKVFLISDAIALCLSVVSAFLLLLARLDKSLIPQPIFISLFFMVYALICTLIAFGSGVCVYTVNKSRWLAILLVCFSCCSAYLIYISLQLFFMSKITQICKKVSVKEKEQ